MIEHSLTMETPPFPPYDGVTTKTEEEILQTVHDDLVYDDQTASILNAMEDLVTETIGEFQSVYLGKPMKGSLMVSLTHLVQKRLGFDYVATYQDETIMITRRIGESAYAIYVTFGGR